MRTQCAYYRQMGLLIKHFGCDPQELTEPDIRDYLIKRKDSSRWAASTLRQCIASLRMFYNEQLGLSWKLWDVVSVREPRKLPVVLTEEEVGAIIQAVRRLRYRVPLELIYNCGLRLSECLNLTVKDIERTGHRLIVRQGKGGKDRFVPLSDSMIEKLTRYWKEHRNPLWLFPNIGKGDNDRIRERMFEAQEPMFVGSLQNAFRQALKDCAVPKQASIHTLRHSYATHLLARGVNIRQLQVYLGHDSIETTTLYTHLIPFNEVRVLEHLEALAQVGSTHRKT